jgi:hypothetical protein
MKTITIREEYEEATQEGDQKVVHLNDGPLDNDNEIEEDQTLPMSVNEDDGMHPNCHDDNNEILDIPNAVMSNPFNDWKGLVINSHVDELDL